MKEWEPKWIFPKKIRLESDGKKLMEYAGEVRGSWMGEKSRFHLSGNAREALESLLVSHYA